MAGISIRVVGAEQSAEKAREAAARAGDLSPAWDEVGSALVVSTQQRFEEGKGPDGNPWPPSIRVLTEGGKTLLDRGTLRSSITHQVIGDGVMVGTSLISAAVHQFGATIRPVRAERLHFMIGGNSVFAQQVTIPARPFLGVDSEDEAMIAGILESYVAAPVEGERVDGTQ